MRLPTAAIALTGLGVLYRLFLREPILTWGATKAEAAATLPGDELLEEADGIATRAIAIDAPPAAVWPWVAQIGPSPRAGAYTYDWIENLLGLNMHSVDHVLPECQHPQVGDTARSSRRGPTPTPAPRSASAQRPWRPPSTHTTAAAETAPLAAAGRQDGSAGARGPADGLPRRGVTARAAAGGTTRGSSGRACSRPGGSSRAATAASRSKLQPPF